MTIPSLLIHLKSVCERLRCRTSVEESFLEDERVLESEAGASAEGSAEGCWGVKSQLWAIVESQTG